MSAFEALCVKLRYTNGRILYVRCEYRYISLSGGCVRSGAEAPRPVATSHAQQQGRTGLPRRRELQRRRVELRRRAEVRQETARRLHGGHLHDARGRRHVLVAEPSTKTRRLLDETATRQPQVRAETRPPASHQLRRRVHVHTRRHAGG